MKQINFSGKSNFKKCELQSALNFLIFKYTIIIEDNY